MKNLYFDIESYSECDLKKAGSYAYAAHESTDIVCLSYYAPDRHQKVKLWVPGDETPLFTDLALDGYRFAAWNADNFDAEMWRIILCEKYGWPWPGYHAFRDVMIDASYAGLPMSLDVAATALDAPPKDKEGHKLMMKLSKPAQITKNLKDPKRHHTEENMEAFYKYCRQDTKALAALGEKIKPLPHYEEVIRSMDHNMNARGVLCDVGLARKALVIREKHREHIGAEMMELTNGIITKPTKRKEILKYLTINGIVTSSVAKDVVKQILEERVPHIENGEEVTRVLKLYQQYNKTSLAKYNRMIIMAGTDWRLRGQQQVWGAHTGRWAGRGVQCQNLARGIFKSLAEYQIARDAVDAGNYEVLLLMYDSNDIMDVLSSLIRTAFIAKPGYEFHVSDFSSIEARVAFWLTGDIAGMHIYNNLGGKLYEETAAAIYGIPVSEVTSKQRAFGKVVALACQYQVGEKTILTQCKNYGIKTTRAACKAAKDAYRDKFKQVVQYWDDLESAAIWAMKNPKEIINVGKLKICFYGDKFRIKLPSGRMMFYHDPKLKYIKTPWGEQKLALTYMAIDQYTRKWARVSTYGGKIFENIVQAIARDLMAEAMVRAEENDMHPVLTVHDEVVIEELLGLYTIADLDDIMTQLPKWAEGLPVDAEGWTGSFYMKS